MPKEVGAMLFTLYDFLASTRVVLPDMNPVTIIAAKANKRTILDFLLQYLEKVIFPMLILEY
jgi:hypothetical protein